MEPSDFKLKPTIVKRILKLSQLVDDQTFLKISRMYYDTIWLANIRLKKKRQGKKKRILVSLSRKDISKIIHLITYFHINDSCIKFDHKSRLAECYIPTYSEQDAWEYFDHFIKGTVIDSFGIELYFPDDFIKSLYKDDDQKHNIDSKNFLQTRAKRLPLIRETISNTTNIFQKIDPKEYLERMYVQRFYDPYIEYYYVIVAKKYKKDRVSPFMAKTAFSMSRYNDLLRRIEKYEIPTRQ